METAGDEVTVIGVLLQTPVVHKTEMDGEMNSLEACKIVADRLSDSYNAVFKPATGRKLVIQPKSCDLFGSIQTNLKTKNLSSLRSELTQSITKPANLAFIFDLSPASSLNADHILIASVKSTQDLVSLKLEIAENARKELDEEKEVQVTVVTSSSSRSRKNKKGKNKNKASSNEPDLYEMITQLKEAHERGEEAHEKRIAGLESQVKDLKSENEGLRQDICDLTLVADDIRRRILLDRGHATLAHRHPVLYELKRLRETFRQPALLINHIFYEIFSPENRKEISFQAVSLIYEGATDFNVRGLGNRAAHRAMIPQIEAALSEIPPFADDGTLDPLVEIFKFVFGYMPQNLQDN
ncbi:hypothetical protein C8J56DRAFT_969993 [Mycena floridula]|nr:hypothetical protein C8J56DRAFT_969993 [Mycena floridula]